MTRRHLGLVVGGILGVGIAGAATAVESTAFPRIYNSETAAGDPPPADARALARITLPAGFNVQLFAGEPDLQQPVAFAFDDRGRLWVVENYTYAESRVRFAPDLRDRVLVLEDADGDGRFDKRTVFWDQGQRVTSIALGFGGVWLTAAPHLLFIPDRDRNDVPDGPPVVLLDGWDSDRIHHNIVNGLKWGPDGWLYGRHGIQAASRVGKQGTPAAERVRVTCGIWRYHPVLRTLETVATGTTNPWGFDYDDYGEMFFINTVIGHLWHVVPGAHYKRMYGDDFDRHAYQLMDQTADHIHWGASDDWSRANSKGMTDATWRAGGGHAHSGLMIYLGDNWPDRYRNQIFTLNFHGRRINNDIPARRGAGYVATHGPDFMMVPDPWFRGVEIGYGPDGGVFVADWSDIGECHEGSGVHRSSGRIYKVSHGRPRSPGFGDLAAKSDAELVALQLHKNDFFARHARRLLQERAAAGRNMTGVHRALRVLFADQTDVSRKLRALWALHVTGGASAAWLQSLTDHPDEHVRVWAIRLLAEGTIDAPAAARFANLAAHDPSGLVQTFLASALRRIPAAGRGSLGGALAARGDFAADRSLSLMIWYGLEPWVAADPQAAVRAVEGYQHRLVRQFVARRVTEEIESRPGLTDDILAVAARSRSPELQEDLLRGVSEELQGWTKAPRPPGWPSVMARLGRSPDANVRRLINELGVVFGDGRVTRQLQEVALNAEMRPEARRMALRTLIDGHTSGLGPLLLRLVADRDTATLAIRGLGAHALAETPATILANWRKLDPEGRQAAVATLVTRASYARPLLDAIASETVRREVLSAYHARQIQSLGDPALTARLEKVWGQVRSTSDDKKALAVGFKQALTPEVLATAALPRGREVFNQVCAPCHKLYGEGGGIGPDLTGADRHNLEYLLQNIVDPSAVVPADFRMSVVHIKDGRVLNGFVSAAGGRTMTIRGVGEAVVVPRAEVAQVTPSDASIMPEGLLEAFPRDDVRNLIAYLMSSDQVPLPREMVKPESGERPAPRPSGR